MDNSENNEKNYESKGLKQAASFFSLFAFIYLFSRFSEYFEGGIAYYLFAFGCFLLYFNVQYFLSKNRHERFVRRDWLKYNGYFILGLLLFYNIINLLISASERVPESVSAWFIPILIAGVILFIIGYGIYFIEKHSKP